MFPRREPSSSSVSPAPKVQKPLPAEALPTRPTATESPIQLATAAEVARLPAASPSVRWWLPKPDSQAGCNPPLAAPAPGAGPQHLPAGRGAQEGSAAPSSSQVSAWPIGKGMGDVGVQANPKSELKSAPKGISLKLKQGAAGLREGIFVGQSQRCDGIDEPPWNPP